jgi:hypothetical protein
MKKPFKNFYYTIHGVTKQLKKQLITYETNI